MNWWPQKPMAPHPDPRALSLAELLDQRDQLKRAIVRILELERWAKWGLPAAQARLVDAALNDARRAIREIDARGGQ